MGKDHEKIIPAREYLGVLGKLPYRANGEDLEYFLEIYNGLPEENKSDFLNGFTQAVNNQKGNNNGK